MDYWGRILVQSTWIVFLLKATLVIAAGSLLTTMLANRPASARYRIWAGVFVVLALLPIIHFGFTGWTLPVPVKGIKNRILRVSATAGMSENTVVSGTLKTTGHGKFTAFLRSDGKGGKVLNRVVASAGKSSSFSTVLWAIWLSGTLFLFLRLILGRVQAHQVFRHSFLLNDDRWSFVAQFVARKIGLHRNTALASHPQVPIPLTFGTVRPVVMLPKSANQWTMERRRIVLLHEFAHIRRRDDLARLAARAVALLFWFHPLSWVAFQKFKMEQEKSCDERVIQSGVRPSDYAFHLVELARGVDWGSAFRPMTMAGAATLGMVRKPELEGRLSEILNHFPNKETGMKLKVAGMFFVIASGILLAVQPVAKAGNMAPDPVVATQAAPAKAAKTKKPATPKKPAKLRKTPKAPIAPKKKKVIGSKIITTVTDDGNNKVIIIKDGDKVQKILVKTGGEGDDDNIIFLGNDGDKAHNVFLMKNSSEKYKAQMQAAMVELKQAMKLLAQKKKDLATLNRDMAKNIGSIKVESKAVKVQLEKVMAELDVKLKAQIKKNAAAMTRMKKANKELAEEVKGRDFKWVEKETQTRHAEAIVEKELKRLEKKEVKGHKVMVWVSEDDVDGDMDALCDHDKRMFIHADTDRELKIKIKIELKEVGKKDRKAIDTALERFEKNLPKGVKPNINRDDNGISLDLNVPKDTKLSDADRKKLENAVEKVMNRIREIKGDKNTEIREIHIKKK